MAAVIDLGSNSWRLVVYAYLPGASWRRVGELQEPVRIAEGLSRSGSLEAPTRSRAGWRRSRCSAATCRRAASRRQAVDAVATSAIRDAANGADLLAVAQERTGLSIGVLSAEEEARLGYVAAVNSTTLADGVVLDLGGGSLQLTSVAGRQAQRVGLVAARRGARHRAAPPGVARGLAQAAQGRARRRARAARRRRRGSPTPAGRLVGMGGAVRNLAAAAQGGAGAGIQGYVLERAALAELVAELAKRPASQRALPGIKAARADIVLGAAVVLETVLELGGFDGIEVTARRPARGRVLQPPAAARLDAAAARRPRRLDPQPRAAVRRRHRPRRPRRPARAAAARLAGRRGRDRSRRPDERELLWAAALLHDIGMTIGYDGHPDHAHYLILRPACPATARARSS